METDSVPLPQRFNCIQCNIKTNNKKDYNKHILTQKHIYRIKWGIIEQENPNIFTCKNCNKTYKARNSLWYHERKCDELNDKNHNIYDKNNDVSELKSLVIEVMKSNNELYKQNIEDFWSQQTGPSQE